MKKGSVWFILSFLMKLGKRPFSVVHQFSDILKAKYCKVLNISDDNGTLVSEGSISLINRFYSNSQLSWKQFDMERGLAHFYIMAASHRRAVSRFRHSYSSCTPIRVSCTHSLGNSVCARLSPSDAQTEPPKAQRQDPHIGRRLHRGTGAERSLSACARGGSLSMSRCHAQNDLFPGPRVARQGWAPGTFLVDVNVRIASGFHTSTKASFFF